MQRLRILVILILLSLMPLYSLAVLNEGQYAFRSLDINNGLSQNTVHAILQDKQGFMWFGTKDDTAAAKFFNQVREMPLDTVGHLAKGEALKIGTMNIDKLNVKRIKM